MKIKVEIEGDGLAYFQQQARRRGLSATRLMQIITTVMVDLKLIDDTLDDEGKTYRANPRQRADKTRSNITGPVSSRPARAFRAAPSRAEIRKDFEQAAANTPDVRSKDDIVRLTPDQVRERVKLAHSMGFDGARGLGTDPLGAILQQPKSGEHR